MSRLPVFGQVLLGLLGAAALIVGGGFLIEGTDFWLYQTFASRREAARREVFEESKSYNDGMAQELWAMQLQYSKADGPGKAALRSTILHRVASYDLERLPLELQRFVSDIRSEQLGGK